MGSGVPQAMVVSKVRLHFTSRRQLKDVYKANILKKSAVDMHHSHQFRNRPRNVESLVCSKMYTYCHISLIKNVWLSSCRNAHVFRKGYYCFMTVYWKKILYYSHWQDCSFYVLSGKRACITDSMRLQPPIRLRRTKLFSYKIHCYNSMSPHNIKLDCRRKLECSM